MMSCQQSQHQTILQHGEAVASKFKDLIAGRTDGWHLPPWVEQLIPLIQNQELLEQYHIYHDCSKPFCITYDQEGKKHFPNHAELSSKIWEELDGCKSISILMKHDMDMHTMKSAEAETYEHIDLAPALLLTALAELHANAEMFGGTESTSFKIKFKAISKLGKALMPKILEFYSSQGSEGFRLQCECAEHQGVHL